MLNMFVPSLDRGFSGPNPLYGCAVGFQDRILFMAVPCVFSIESSLWLCRGFSGSNPAFSSCCGFSRSNLESGCAMDFHGRILRLRYQM